jgi:hypothetical protein
MYRRGAPRPGATTDIAQAVVTDTTTGEKFYVAMTRSCEANHAYVTAYHHGDDHS